MFVSYHRLRPSYFGLIVLLFLLQNVKILSWLLRILRLRKCRNIMLLVRTHTLNDEQDNILTLS